MPLIETQTVACGAIEVGHTVRRRSSRLLLKRSLPVCGIVLALYLVALVVRQAPVLVRRCATELVRSQPCLLSQLGSYGLTRRGQAPWYLRGRRIGT